MSSPTRKIADIPLVFYGEAGRSCEPTFDEIHAAVTAGQIELRGYQQHLEELKLEWMQGSQGGQDIDAWCRLVKTYHTRRIAYFAVTGWDDPVDINAAGHLTDGLHRLKAARFLGHAEIRIRHVP